MALGLKVSLVLVAACSLTVMPRIVAAQQHNITIDRSFGSPATLSGPNYAITANLGKQVGSNLFHSFGKFGLSTGETAAFSGPATINNVIGRVTGGNPSSIDGKIQSSIAKANLYLINPSGMVFGPHATVDVKGSFHASTADYLKLSDGAKFQATNPDASTLSAASPAAFGFLTATPSKITVNGSTLGPVPGTLGVVAGPVSITNRATLSAPAGTIHVTSVAGTGEVPVDPLNTPALTATSFGRVNIKGGSTLDVSNPSGVGAGGSVFIRSGALTIEASEINGDNYGSLPGGVLSLRGESQITLSDGANVHAVAMGSGNGAGVMISTAPSGVIMVDAATVLTDSLGPGNGGALSLESGRLTLTNGAGLTSSSQGRGNGGPIKISASSVLLDGASTIGSLTAGAGLTGPSGNPIPAGAGGAISINAGSLTIQGGASIATTSAGGGAGGAVALNIGGMLVANLGSITSEADANGDGGPIEISASSVLLDGASTIGSMTTGAGLTGPSGNPIPAGAGGAITITAGSLTIQDGASIAIDSAGDGPGGAVALDIGGMLTVANLGSITSAADASGDAGPITISAGSMELNGPMFPQSTGIFSGTSGVSPGGFGPGGAISIDAGSLTIQGGGTISTASSGDGAAGAIGVNVGDMLTFANLGTIASVALANGPGGPIRISAGAMLIDGSVAQSLLAQAGISSFALPGAGKAGDIAVTSGSLSILTNGLIGSATLGMAAGSVSVNVAGALTIDGANSNPQLFGTGISSLSLGGGTPAQSRSWRARSRLPMAA